MIDIKTISFDSPHLATIKQLGKLNRKTLGLFPDGAFDDYAHRGWIIGAVNGDKCVGYLAYRISGLNVYIVHLRPARWCCHPWQKPRWQTPQWWYDGVIHKNQCACNK